jgi:hypothetical protein
MEQLSGIDSFMLHNERGNVYNHISGSASTIRLRHRAARSAFATSSAHFGARLSLHRLFRRRVVNVPFGIDRPYWLDLPDVDIEFHVRHIACASARRLAATDDPGGRRLHSRPLDRSHARCGRCT